MGADAELKGKISLDNSAFERGLRSASERASAFGRQIAGAFGGALAIGSITRMGHEAIELADHLGDMSEKLGVGVESLQRISNVAEIAGSSMDGVASAFNKLRVAQDNALMGNDKMRKAFAAAGISLEDLKSMSAEEIFYKISDAIKDGSLHGMEFAVVTKLMGKGATALIPLMSQGKEGIEALGNTMGIVSGKSVGELKAMADEMKKFGSIWTASKTEFFSAFKEEIFSLLYGLERGALGVKHFFGAIKDMLTLNWSGFSDNERKRTEEVKALEQRQRARMITEMTPAELQANMPRFSEEEVKLANQLLDIEKKRVEAAAKEKKASATAGQEAAVEKIDKLSESLGKVTEEMKRRDMDVAKERERTADAERKRNQRLADEAQDQALKQQREDALAQFPSKDFPQNAKRIKEEFDALEEQLRKQRKLRDMEEERMRDASRLSDVTVRAGEEKSKLGALAEKIQQSIEQTMRDQGLTKELIEEIKKGNAISKDIVDAIEDNALE